MSSRYQICCVKRSDLGNHDRRIRSIGGVNPDGSRWTISEETAIAGIESGQWNFYVSLAGQAIEVIVVKSRHGGKYIKAAEDRLHPDSLLALPDCR